MPSFNEEHNIKECLESLFWADEILVVDSFSKDNTVSIEKEYADKVLEHEYKYSTAQKNWTIPQAAHEWIILLDADERCTPELQDEVEALLNSEEEPGHGAYWIYRRNFFLGREIKHCHWNKDKVIRLFKRDNYSYEDVQVHGEIQPQDNIGVLKNRLKHYSFRSIEDYFIKLNRYTLWGAQKAMDKGMKANIFNIIGRPAWKFFSYFILNLGFLDGMRGLIISVLSSVSVFLRYVKLWELQKTQN